MEIVIASNNQHKIEEYRQIFNQFDIQVRSLKDEGIILDVDENGKTFEDNSLLKAKACLKYTDKVVLSDDSGLIIDSLPEILGVHTSRFLGEDTPYQIKWAKVLSLLEGKDRKGEFVCCITILNLTDQPLVFKGICNGHIANKPAGNSGFGYDPIFIPDGYEKTFSELGEEEKNKISHRGKASLKMIEFLKEYFK